MRALAIVMKDTEVATLVIDLAAEYDKFADRAARKADDRTSPLNGKSK